MLFPTIAFALFFVVAFCANWLLRPHHAAWRVVMVALSLFFYGYWRASFVLLIVISIVANWLLAYGAFTERHTANRRTGALWTVRLAVVLNLGLLGWFKYYDFFVTSVLDGLSQIGLGTTPPLIQVLLPVGISFFTFQAMSYVIDVGRGEFDHPLPLLDVAFYLSFFPQLVAGPIVRATDMAPQINIAPDPRRVPVGEAFWLIGQGLLKKVVISSYLATNLVDPVFGVPSDHSQFELLMGMYGYAVQIYADFSGYTDIAIGCALLLGFRFPQNFDSPYTALSIQNFWQRWHMTLSTWLRDYLYIPLGGNRGGSLLTYRNLFLTMLLGGLWHGAAWNFVIWGAIHGVALGIERLVSERDIGGRAGLAGETDPMVSATVRWLITFHVVCVAWIFFRAETGSLAISYLGQLIGLSGSSTPSSGDLLNPLLMLVVGGSIAIQFVPDAIALKGQRLVSEAHTAVQIAGCATILTLIDAFGPEGVAPFIYFQF